MSPETFEWDESLYAGSAEFYATGRLPYPQAMADEIAAELKLDGHGRRLDVGCGPGSVALILAPLFESVVGVDADEDMIAEARRQADCEMWEMRYGMCSARSSFRRGSAASG